MAIDCQTWNFKHGPRARGSGVNCGPGYPFGALTPQLTPDPWHSPSSELMASIAKLGTLNMELGTRYRISLSLASRKKFISSAPPVSRCHSRRARFASPSGGSFISDLK